MKGKNKTVANVVDISLHVLSCECDNYLVCYIFMVILWFMYLYIFFLHESSIYGPYNCGSLIHVAIKQWLCKYMKIYIISIISKYCRLKKVRESIFHLCKWKLRWLDIFLVKRQNWKFWNILTKLTYQHYDKRDNRSNMSQFVWHIY